jgi:hypothetical protein
MKIGESGRVRYHKEHLRKSLRAVDITGDVRTYVLNQRLPGTRQTVDLCLSYGFVLHSFVVSLCLVCDICLFLCMCVSPKFVTGGCWVDFRSKYPTGYDSWFAIFYLLQFPFYDRRPRTNICPKFWFWKLVYLETGLVNSPNIAFSAVPVFVF